MKQPDYREAELIVSLSGTPLRALQGAARGSSIVLKRWIVAYVIRRQLGWSLPQIGHFLCRHHSTIIHGIGLVDSIPHLHVQAVQLQTLWEQSHGQATMIDGRYGCEA